MAIVTLVFTESADGLASKMSVTTETGATAELTKPGVVEIEAKSSVTIAVELVESDILVAWHNTNAKITTTSGSSATPPYNTPVSEFKISESIAALRITPVVGYNPVTATLYIEDWATGQWSTVVASGPKELIDVVFPEAEGDSEVVTLGWSEIINTLTTPRPVTEPSEVVYLPGDSVRLSGPREFGGMISAVWTAYRITHGRNGIAPHLWYQGQMREAAPYVWQDGRWVELQSALEIQGYFELEE